MKDDVIYRQDAINAFEKKLFGYLPDKWMSIKTLEELPPAQPEPHWIPCEEEMPKEKDAGVLQKIGIKKKSDNVLVTIDIENVKMVEVACTWDGMWKWEGTFAFPKWEVIAWMPFPAPYKEAEIG